MRSSSQLSPLPDKLLCFLLPGLFFVTPLSSSAKSILMIASMVSVLCSAACRAALKNMLTTRWFRAVLILFGVALVGCLWSPAALNEKGLVLEKWAKLLTLPCLIAGFQQAKTRQWAIKGFIFAMLLTCMLALLMHWAGASIPGAKMPDGVFRNHIMTSMMMTFATYLCVWLFAVQNRPQRFFYAALAVLFSYYLLFINQSRSGYVLYVLLMITSMLQWLTKRQALGCLLGFVMVCLTAAYWSPTLQHSVSQAIENIKTYDKDKNTSVGYRMQFHQFAHQLFIAHPFIGNGTGSFTYAFRTENPVPAWTQDPSHSGRLLEPHSQYWLVAAELGLLGLGALGLFYAECCLLALHLQSMRPIAMALLLIFAVGNISDSLLFYSGSGYFFLLFFALCFSECTKQPSATEALNPTLWMHNASV